jgi:hypothetical protein
VLADTASYFVLLEKERSAVKPSSAKPSQERPVLDRYSTNQYCSHDRFVLSVCFGTYGGTIKIVLQLNLKDQHTRNVSAYAVPCRVNDASMRFSGLLLAFSQLLSTWLYIPPQLLAS